MRLKDYQLITPTANKVITAAQFNNEDLWTETAYEGVRSRNKQADIAKSRLFRDTIGVIYRCIDVRAAMLSSLPWTILRGEEVFIDSETAWEEEQYAWLENLTNFLYLTEASLLLSSEAFWLKESNLLGSNTGIRWLAAPYVTPLYDETSGIIGFERKYGQDKRETFTPEEIAYFWVQNPLSELTPDIPQAMAAANSANVIMSYEKFVEKFYERGAVKATILKVDRSTPPKERERLREFWKNFMSGNKNAYTTEVVSGDIEAEVIGEGAGDSEKTEVLVSRRKDIATAMGVPYSLLFGDTSSSYTAGPTEEKNFLNYTIIPRAKMIQRVMNMSVFKEQGLYFRFNFGALPAFKEAGEVISKIFTTYTNALIPHSIAAKIAGIVMPEGITYDDLDKYVAEERERQFEEKKRIVEINSKLAEAGGKQAKPKGEDNNAKAVEEKQFRKWLKNRGGVVDISGFAAKSLNDEELTNIYVSFLTERGSDDNPPFGLSDGATKTLVTYGNPDGEDDSVLRGLEDDATQAIWDAWRGLGDVVDGEVDSSARMDFQRQIEAIFEVGNEAVEQAILVGLLTFADLGVERATAQVQKFVPGFSSENAHAKAREWATKRAVEVFAIVVATNRKRISAIIQEWNTANLPNEWLAGEVKKMIDQNRANVIAETESIAVVTQAALFVFEETRLVRYVRFTAVGDERTCPICGRLHNQVFPLGAAPKVPLHPRCRCQYRSVVSKEDLQMFYEMVRHG